MKKFKSLATLGLALTMAASLAGCSNGGASTPSAAPAEEETTVKIGFTAMNLTDPFQIAVRDTVKDLAEAEGWNSSPATATATTPSRSTCAKT